MQIGGNGRTDADAARRRGRLSGIMQSLCRKSPSRDQRNKTMEEAGRYPNVFPTVRQIGLVADRLDRAQGLRVRCRAPAQYRCCGATAGSDVYFNIGREVHHRTGLRIHEDVRHGAGIGDIGEHKMVARMASRLLKSILRRCISQFVPAALALSPRSSRLAHPKPDKTLQTVISPIDRSVFEASLRPVQILSTRDFFAGHFVTFAELV